MKLACGWAFPGSGYIREQTHRGVCCRKEDALGRRGTQFYFQDVKRKRTGKELFLPKRDNWLDTALVQRLPSERMRGPRLVP